MPSHCLHLPSPKRPRRRDKLGSIAHAPPRRSALWLRLLPAAFAYPRRRRRAVSRPLRPADGIDGMPGPTWGPGAGIRAKKDGGFFNRNGSHAQKIFLLFDKSGLRAADFRHSSGISRQENSWRRTAVTEERKPGRGGARPGSAGIWQQDPARSVITHRRINPPTGRPILAARCSLFPKPRQGTSRQLMVEAGCAGPLRSQIYAL